MMIEVAAAGLGSAAVVYGYHRLTGCSGGHVWGDWENTNRWRVNPFRHSEDVSIQRKQERHCEAEGCTSSDEQWSTVHNEVYAVSLRNALADLTETHYECPQCFEVVPGSERETKWEPMYVGGKGKARYEICPKCHYKSTASDWKRVGWNQ